MTNQNIFQDEWRACLAEHYVYVVRAGDTLTEATLRAVLLETGFTPQDIELLRDQAYEESPGD
ncbi:MAG: hypothetical protein ACLFTK_06250 [Anaerolineales bacterium]